MLHPQEDDIGSSVDPEGLREHSMVQGSGDRPESDTAQMSDDAPAAPLLKR